jgi:hypothetical protein
VSRRRKVAAMGVFFLCSVFPIGSEAQDPSAVCLAMVSDAAHNVAVDTSSSSYYHMYYQNYCNEDGSTNDSAIAASGSAVIDAVPVGLKGSSSDKKAQWSQFCKTEHDISFGTSSNYSYQSLVVSQALASANQCLSIVKDHAYTMTYKIMTPDTLVVNFGIPSGQNITIHGVKTDESIKCTGSNLAQSGSFVYKEGVGQTVSATYGSTSISCVRKPFSSMGGTSFYQQAAVEVDTNVGQLNIFWPQQTVLPLTTASDIESEINALKAETDFNKLPIGTLLPWYNKSDAVPRGWTKCDGSDTAHCPNLSGMFLRGSVQPQVTSTGGSESAVVGEHGSNNRRPDGNGWSIDGGHYLSNDRITVQTIPPYTSVLYILKISDH